MKLRRTHRQNKTIHEREDGEKLLVPMEETIKLSSWFSALESCSGRTRRRVEGSRWKGEGNDVGIVG